MDVELFELLGPRGAAGELRAFVAERLDALVEFPDVLRGLRHLRSPPGQPGDKLADHQRDDEERNQLGAVIYIRDVEPPVGSNEAEVERDCGRDGRGQRGG